MLFSGRKGYEYVNILPKELKISRDRLIEMLKYENELRLSEKWLALMEKEIIESNDESPSALDGYMTDKISPTIRNLQLEVVKKFGYDLQKSEAVNILRSALATYPDDDQVKNAANYLKYNRIDKGKFKVGDTANCDGIEVMRMKENKDEVQKEEKKDDGGYGYDAVKLTDLLNKDGINLLIGISVT